MTRVRLAGLAACAVARWHIAQVSWTLAMPLDTSTMVLVVAAVAVALLLGRPEPYAVPPDVALSVRRSKSGQVVGTLLALVGMGGAAYASHALASSWATQFDWAAPLLIGGIATCSIGLFMWDGAGGISARRLPMPGWERLLFLAVVLLSFALRFYRYGYFPPDGVCAVEEPQSGMGAHAILHYGDRPWEFVLDRWMPVPFFALLGQSLTALRLPFTLVSALTVVPLYLLLRYLVSWPVAVFAAALFAMSRWHLMYARLAHAVFPTTFVVVLVLLLCARTQRRGGLVAYPWIGFLSGLTLYAYAGYRGTTLFVSLFLASTLIGHLREFRRALLPTAWQRARRQALGQAVGCGLACLAFAATVIPLGYRLREHPAYYFEAANRSLLNKGYYTSEVSAFIAQRVERLRETALMFHHFGDGSPTFNLPGAPMLDPVSGVLFTIGLAYCVAWGRHRWQGFFAFMFLTLLLLGTTFVQNLDIRRLQGIIPLIFVLIAYAADRFVGVARGWLGPRARVPLVGLALLLTGLAFADNYDIYFRQTINNPGVRMAFHNRYTVALRYLRSLPPNGFLLFVSDVLNFFMPNDFTWLLPPAVPGKVTHDLLPLFAGEHGPWEGRDLRVLMQEPMERDDLAQLIAARFPGARCAAEDGPDQPPNLVMTACQIPWPPATEAFSGGVRARYFQGKGTIPVLDRVEPAISYGFVPARCQWPANPTGLPCRAEWEGAWEAPADGMYDLRLEVREGTGTLTVDGNAVHERTTLTSGPHRVRAEARFRSIEEVGARLRWRDHAGHSWQLMRFAPPVPPTPQSAPGAAPEGVPPAMPEAAP